MPFQLSFHPQFNNDNWILTSVYGPCDPEGKAAFMEWFENINMPNEINWLVVGDFNLIRKPEDRNRLGSSPREMLLFNNAISTLGLVEIPLHGRKYTWTNKQQPPLLERLDWFFSSQSWTLSYPLTIAHSLIMETSDRWPCVVEMKTSIPKGRIFRFENYWLSHPDFLTIVSDSWSIPTSQQDPTKILTARFKALRSSLKSWHAQLSNLKKTISNVKLVISLLDAIEEWRDLELHEWNFRDILNQKLADLLHK